MRAPPGRRPVFVQLVPEALDRIAAKHDLTGSARDALAWLVLLADWRTHRVPCQSTTELGRRLGMARNLAIEVVAQLVEADAVRQVEGALEVLAYDELAAQGDAERGVYVPVRAAALDST